MIRQNEIFNELLERMEEISYKMDTEEVTTILEIAIPEGQFYYSDEIQDLYQELTNRINSHRIMWCTDYYFLDSQDRWIMLIIEK